VKKILLGILVLVSVMALASCSTLKDELGLSSQAGIKYNKQSYSEKNLDGDLNAIKNNKELKKLFEQASEPLVKDGKLTDTYVASWANIQLQILAIKEERLAKKLKITKADKKTALTQAKQLFSQDDESEADKIWKDFPKSFQNRLVDNYAEQVALLRAAPKVTDKEIKDYYEKNKDQYNTCATGKNVSHILVATEKEAKDIKKQIDGGESFTKLAKDKSTDPGSKDKGGDLGCFVEGQFVTEFENAVKALPLDKVSDPVKTEFGYHLIKVSAYKAPTLDSLKSSIKANLEPEKQQSLFAKVQDNMKKAKIKVLSKYGKVQNQDGTPTIVTKDTKKESTTSSSTPAAETQSSTTAP
jgi:foldase protein PrsA